MTQVSIAAASTSSGIAIAVVANVAASSSFHAPRRLAIDQAASGRKSANSSGSACGSSATSRANGETSSCADSEAARVPSA